MKMLFRCLILSSIVFAFILLLLKKQILFGITFINDDIVKKNTDYCIIEKEDYRIFKNCNIPEIGKVDVIMLHGVSSEGVSHIGLKKYASSLIYSGFADRVILPKILSLSLSPKWSPIDTEKEITDKFQMLEQKFSITKEEITVFAICGSGNPFLKVLAEGKIIKPRKVIFYNPYYSFISLLSTLNLKKQKIDTHILAIIYYNSIQNLTKEEKKSIENYFNNSKSGNDEFQAKTILEDELYQKLSNYKVDTKLLESVSEIILFPQRTKIEFVILSSLDDSIPYSEGEKIYKSLKDFENINVKLNEVPNHAGISSRDGLIKFFYLIQSILPG